jgi:MSHA pilin protein MshA
MNTSKNDGFTLIELVVVITILGILAAFAVPKFVALDQQARISTVNGLAGSVKSAASLARGMSMAMGSNPATVPMEGVMVTMSNNYPDGTATGIAAAVNANIGAGGDFTFTAGAGGGAAMFTRNGAPDPADCVVDYAPATPGFPPTVAVVVAGC